MPSVITWLDVSSDEQRRMRELAAMFTQRNSRDELGIGQIRDGISDVLFPGTSTLHTRARYLLLVPWSFQHAARVKSPGKNGKRQPDATELALIDPLRASSDSDGLLGARAGVHLQNLPSSVYWTMLQRYGILNRPASRAEALAASVPRTRESDDGSVTASSIWSVPAAPEEFPTEIPDGFALTADEAAWLRDRVFEHAPGTLLAHLMLRPPQSESATAWSDPAASAAPERASTVLAHAHRFSAIMHGAQLLYNLLLSEESDRPELQDEYRARLAQWSVELPVGYATWQIDELLRTIHRERGSRLPVAPAALRFVRDWSALVQRLDPATILDAPDARTLIRTREKIKGAKARLGNPKRLQAWTGASGSGRLTFRWATVRRFATDIHEGLDRA